MSKRRRASRPQQGSPDAVYAEFARRAAAGGVSELTIRAMGLAQLNPPPLHDEYAPADQSRWDAAVAQVTAELGLDTDVAQLLLDTDRIRLATLQVTDITSRAIPYPPLCREVVAGLRQLLGRASDGTRSADPRVDYSGSVAVLLLDVLHTLPDPFAGLYVSRGRPLDRALAFAGAWEGAALADEVRRVDARIDDIAHAKGRVLVPEADVPALWCLFAAALT